MPEQDNQKGTLGEGLPWGFVLDPAANVRALGDVQRRGLQAARELVDRVVSTIDHSGSPPDASRNGARSTGAEQKVPLGDLMQAWWELAARVMAAVPTTGSTPSSRPAPGEGSIEVDVTGVSLPTPWRLRADTSGRLLVPAELWLHNPSSHPVGPIRLSVGDLRASVGTLLGPGCLRFDPSEVVDLPARSARGVVMTLSAGEPLVPGTYRGLVQADGAPNLWVTLEIAVEREPS
jgi:hypothetical protein